jgi:hypothetical protein
VLVEMGQQPLRLHTDVAGDPFWTIVAEAKVEQIATGVFQPPTEDALWFKTATH